MCSDSPSPDPAIGQAARENAAIAREALAYYRQKDIEQKPRQARLDDLTEKLATQQISTSKFNDDQARATWDRYNAVGIPAENAMYADARNYDTQDARDKAAGDAATDISSAIANAGEARRRTMMRMGVNPADGRYQAAEQEAAADGALAKAGAMNSARSKVKDMGIMLKKDAASFARGMPGSAAQTFGVAGAAGGQASGAVQGAIQSANSIAGMMNTGFGTGMSGNSSSANILSTDFQNRMQASSNSGLMAGIGGIAQGIGSAGGVAAFFSDRKMKKKIKPVDGKQALAGIEKTPVTEWEYKPHTAGDDGGQRHVGAMAQDMQKNMGEDVAPGGKVVDVISAIGANMAATQELAKQVKQLAGKAKKKGTA